MTRHLWHAISGMLVPAWLLLAVVAVAIRPLLPHAPWLMVHLLLLGAVSTAILIWSQHFADTLLRRGAESGRFSLGVRLLLHTLGAAMVLAGMANGWWPAVLAGGILVGGNALAHSLLLMRQARGSLPSRFGSLVRYYIAAGVALAGGVTLGVVLARSGAAGEAYDRLLIAHVGLNLLGWVGLTVIGTVALLWPTVLHSTVSQTTTASARGTLPVLIAGIALLGLGAVVDVRPVAAVGVLLYLLGLGRVLAEVVSHGRRSPAVNYAGWSLGASLAWFGASTLGFGLYVAFAPSWAAAADRLNDLVPGFAVGFAAQILLGALTYLLPVVLGGGPRAVKATARELDRVGLARVIAVNVGVIVYLLPVPGPVKVTVSVVVVATMASFLVLMTRALRVNRTVRKSLAAEAAGAAPSQA